MRLAFHSIVLASLLIGVLAGALTDNNSVSGLLVLLILGYLVVLRANPLPRLIEKEIIQEIECSACGEAIDLVGNWSCSCGFVTWEPRHALSPCRQCKTAFEWVQCPRCEQSLRT